MLKTFITAEQINDERISVSKTQNSSAALGKNWSVNGSKTLFNSNNLENYCRKWQKFSSSGDYDILFSPFTLLRINEQNKSFVKSWLDQSITSSLWQYTNQEFRFRLNLVFVVDPPFTMAKKILDEFREKYSYLADFNVQYNKECQFWSGSYNTALDMCRDANAEYAVMIDCDDVSHPERFFWSHKILSQNTDYKCLSFVPIFLKGINQRIWEAGNIDTWHPHLFDDNILVFFLSCLMYFRDGKENPVFTYNPNSITLTKDVINKVRFRKELVNDDKNILFSDQLFIYEILHHFPFGCIENDRLMLGHRRHNISYTAVNNTRTNHYRSFLWQRILSRQARNKAVSIFGKELIENIRHHLSEKYSWKIKDSLFDNQFQLINEFKKQI